MSVRGTTWILPCSTCTLALKVTRTTCASPLPEHLNASANDSGPQQQESEPAAMPKKV